MLNNNDIEQQLREGFPFAKQWFFNYTDGCAYYLQSEQATIALNCHYPHSAFTTSWGAKLTTENNPWTLAANEGSTPAIAIANLKQAIAQAAAFAGDSVSEAKSALQNVRQYQQAWLEHGVGRVYEAYEDPEKALDEILG